MIKLEFATDIRKSCKTCIRFHKEGQFCMIQESNTGGNPHPPIPNPEAWTCNMQKTVAELLQKLDTPCAGCEAATNVGLCKIDQKLSLSRPVRGEWIEIRRFRSGHTTRF